MKSILKKISLAVFFVSSSFAAQATSISAINMGVRESGHSVISDTNFGSALAAWAAAAGVGCDVSLSALHLVGSVQTCTGPRRNIATLFSVDVTQNNTTYFEFGADWGRGGFAYVTNSIGFLGTYDDDYWWSKRWGHPDVIDFKVPGAGSYTLNLLGFEGCCGGAMSLRHRGEGGQWMIAAVNAVPEPGSLALLGLGLFGMGLAKRRKS